MATQMFCSHIGFCSWSIEFRSLKPHSEVVWDTYDHIISVMCSVNANVSWCIPDSNVWRTNCLRHCSSRKICNHCNNHCMERNVSDSLLPVEKSYQQVITGDAFIMPGANSYASQPSTYDSITQDARFPLLSVKCTVYINLNIQT